MVLYILIFEFLERRREEKRLRLNNRKHSLNLICSLFLREYNFDFTIVPTYFNIAIFSEDLLAIKLILSYVLVTRQTYT